MSFNHVVAWIDHSQAHLIHFNPETAETEVIKAHSTHPNQHGTGTDARYFDDVAKALNGAQEILLVGPGLEKTALLKHLAKHQHDLAEKVVAVETVDHPTDGQLLAYARKYFVKVDLFR